jgi:hypothetical protein
LDKLKNQTELVLRKNQGYQFISWLVQALGEYISDSTRFEDYLDQLVSDTDNYELSERLLRDQIVRKLLKMLGLYEIQGSWKLPATISQEAIACIKSCRDKFAEDLEKKRSKAPKAAADILQNYLSSKFVFDSDAESDDDEFFKREALLREKNEQRAFDSLQMQRFESDPVKKAIPKKRNSKLAEMHPSVSETDSLISAGSSESENDESSDPPFEKEQFSETSKDELNKERVQKKRLEMVRIFNLVGTASPKGSIVSKNSTARPARE